MNLHGELTLKLGQLTAGQVYEGLASTFEAHGFAEQHFRGAARRPSARSDNRFRMRGSLFVCDFVPIDYHDLDLLLIESTAPLAQFTATLEALVGALNAKQGFLHSADYYLWQNAEQPAQYEAAGKDHSTLPKVHNGLPPPLAALWIDISRNPGRRYLRQGIQEAVSSPMWLRADQLGEQQLERLSRCPRFSIASNGMHLQIRHTESPFTEESQADQEYLRNVCFGFES